MKPAYLKYSILLLLTWVCTYSFSQTIYYNTSHEGLYHYLDEMANDGLIELNSVVKPYSRAFIASKLKEIFEQQDKLNKRQKSELDFFLRDFNKELMPNKNFKKRIDLFYYKDSLFTLSLIHI